MIHLTLLILLLVPPLAGADNTRFIQDAEKNTIEFPAPFKRIISLYSAHTENLSSLGAKDQIIGISQSDDFPAEILSKPKLSYREDAEKFIALHPDLILVRPMIERSYPQFIKKLRMANITVISLQPKGVDEMFDYWRALAVLTGKEHEAEQMIASFQSRLKKIDTILANNRALVKPKVYFQSIHTKSKTFSETSIAMFVLEQAGGLNIATDARQVRKTNIAYYPKEQLLAKGQEVDIFLAQVGRMNPVTTEMIEKEPGYKAVKAVRENRVYLVEEQLVSRPTLRIAEGIEKLFSIFHPHLVSKN